MLRSFLKVLKMKPSKKSLGQETQEPVFLSQHSLCDLEQVTGLPGITKGKGNSTFWTYPQAGAQLCPWACREHFTTLASLACSENWGHDEHPVG